MADISSYISEISNAKTGSELRAPILNALMVINEQGKDVTGLAAVSDGIAISADETFFAKQSDMAKLLPFDAYPKENSAKLVTSGLIFSLIGDIDNIDLEVNDEWLT